MKILSRVTSGLRQMKSIALAACLAVVGSIAAAPAMAQTAAVEFDPAPVLGIVTQATTFVVAIGTAVLIFLMVAKGIRWARKAG